MSEPITRADYAKWLLSCGDLETHAMFEDWCAHNPAESASPPRVPGASAQFAKVGVQCGPGQPTEPPQNIAELIETVAYERGYRAGIEEAAQAAHDAVKRFTAYQSIYPAKVRDVIRALAAAPPAALKETKQCE